MSGATQVATMLTKAFPGLRVTDVSRTQAEQDALVSAGKTRSHNSQHLDDNGIDVVLPKGVTPAAVRKFLSDNGHNPGEFLTETGKGDNQGTGAHLHIGLAPKGGDPASGGSTYDRLTAGRTAGPSIAEAYRAYKAGEMEPQEAAQFENAVINGHIILPRGAQINKVGAVPTLPADLIQAYNSHAMDDDPQARAEIERAVHAGEVSLPRGTALKAPPARTSLEQMGGGVRNVMTGIGGLADLPAGAVNGIINTVAGTNLSATPFRDVANAGADAMGLAKPESDTEKLLAGGTEGATQGLATFGLGSLAAGASGTTGAVAKTLAANPILDTLSGATSGVSQETARQAGAGPVGQLAAGLVGGFAPVGVAGALERAATRAPKTLETAVAETPRAAVFDETGNLTPHGQEVAARHGVSPEEVRAAYEAPPSARAKVANDEASPAMAREATNDQPVAPQDRPEEAAAPISEAPAPEVAPAPSASPDALPETALARVEQGKEFGVDYTRGQATKNFDIQDAEQRLKASNGADAEQMRQFIAKQQEQVKAAVHDLISAFGDPEASAVERGKLVQDAAMRLRDEGQKGVTALYEHGNELAEKLGQQHKELTRLDTNELVGKMREIWSNEANPDNVRNGLRQLAAEYSLIGEKPVTIEGETSVTLRQPGTNNTRQITFTGDPKTLDVGNAERFRQRINDMWEAGKSNKQSEIKPVLDRALVQKLNDLAESDVPDIAKAFGRARAAHIAQKKTFEAGDIVQRISSWKKGLKGTTAILDPEQVMRQSLASTSNLKRVKAVLLSKPTIESKAAWNTIQAHGLASIFEKATTRNTNVGGEITDAISGAKLRTEIERFGVDKLKILLEPEDFNRLMRLRRVIEDTTIPITGTTNPSGSGNLLMRLSASIVGRIPLGGGLFARVSEPVAHLWKRAKEIAEAKEVVAGTDYTPEKAAVETAKPGQVGKKPGIASMAAEKAQDFTKAFIDIYSSPRVIAPILAASSGEEK